MLDPSPTEAPEVPEVPETADWRTVRVGVLLGPVPARIGDWLADAAAFDAGGVDTLWIDSAPVDPAGSPELDVLALAAALAVTTFWARLVVALPARDLPPARTLDTVMRLSHGRLALVADAGQGTALDAVAPGVQTVRPVPDEPGAFEDTGDAGARRWLSIPAPDGRTAWRAALADAAGRGVHGVLVPADPRVLDLLRNPDEPGERHDLQLAQG